MTARPRHGDVERLAGVRAPWCVTVYGSWDDWMGGPRLETRAGEQVRAAERLLQQTGAPDDVAAALVRRLRELPATDGAADGRTRSIAIFAADGILEVFALTTAPAAWVGVSDRFLIAPLLEAALALVPPVFALALSENQVRLIDVTSAPPRVVHVEGLPDDLRSVEHLDLAGDRDTLAHLKISEDPKVRLRSFARAVDAAVAPALRRNDAVLVIAAAEPLADIYRAVSSTETVVATALAGNHDDETPERIASRAVELIAEHRRAKLDQTLRQFAELPARDRVLVQFDEVEQATAAGAVEMLLVDTDRRTSVPAETERMHIALDRVDELVRTALEHGTVIVPVPAADLPTTDPVAAVLRYAFVPQHR